MVTHRQNWGEERVYFVADDGELDLITAQWTDAAPQDPFVTASGGRAMLRITDLLDLVKLVEDRKHTKGL